MKQNLLLAFLSATLLCCCAPADQQKNTEPPTLILFNGTLFTADSSTQGGTAIALRGDRILALGTDADILRLAGPATQRIDLAGNFAMPGFIEGHGHFHALGRSHVDLNLLQSKSWQEIAEQVAQKAKNTPKGDWIEGRGWHQEKWNADPGPTVNGYPYHDALSAASLDHPVVLDHASGHGLIANQRAMELAGVSKETPDPLGGRIVRDAKGNLTGVFEENAMGLIQEPLDAWKNKRSEAEKTAAFERAVQLAADDCLRKGITSFQDAGSNFWELAQYRRLAEAGQLPLRLWVMAAQPAPDDMPKLGAFPQIGIGQGFFTSRSVKAYFDGALGSYGAWLLAPYNDKPGFTGQNTTPGERIRDLSKVCLQYKLQLCVHAIGDRANREVLDMFQAASPTDLGLRWRIEHAQHLDAADIPRFRALGVIASMQAIHCTSDAPFVVKRLGAERARIGAYAWKGLLHAGAHLANGTDAPVEDVNPLPCLYASVTRKQAPGGMAEAFFPEQCMSREEALLSYTIWNAYAAFEEADKGSLSPGKYADIVVLSKDLLRCPPLEILEAKVLHTVVAGKVRTW